jgi:hypothetical protein
MAKIVAEKLVSREETKLPGQDAGKKGIIPKSYLD